MTEIIIGEKLNDIPIKKEEKDLKKTQSKAQQKHGELVFSVKLSHVKLVFKKEVGCRKTEEKTKKEEIWGVGGGSIDPPRGWPGVRRKYVDQGSAAAATFFVAFTTFTAINMEISDDPMDYLPYVSSRVVKFQKNSSKRINHMDLIIKFDGQTVGLLPSKENLV